MYRYTVMFELLSTYLHIHRYIAAFVGMCVCIQDFLQTWSNKVQITKLWTFGRSSLLQ